MHEVSESDADLVLLSGGASGKVLAVRLAQATGKVVLDVGEALNGVWV
jgi:pyruvate/2-oxoglutarate dehydrogenase complex dihydrolipoamide dehydrogenase (E3) component